MFVQGFGQGEGSYVGVRMDTGVTTCREAFTVLSHFIIIIENYDDKSAGAGPFSVLNNHPAQS